MCTIVLYRQRAVAVLRESGTCVSCQLIEARTYMRLITRPP